MTKRPSNARVTARIIATLGMRPEDTPLALQDALARLVEDVMRDTYNAGHEDGRARLQRELRSLIGCGPGSEIRYEI